MNRVAEAKNVKGNVYWQEGSVRRPFYSIRRFLHFTLLMPLTESHKLSSQHLPSTRLMQENKVRQVLIGQPSNRLKMTLLHEVVSALRVGIGTLMIGRQLYFDQEYAASNQYLLKAADLGLPHPEISHRKYKAYRRELVSAWTI